MKNPWRELDLLFRWKVSFQTSYDGSKKLHRCRSKVLGTPEASSILKPPSSELHNVESPPLSLSLSLSLSHLNILGESRNGDLGLQVFKISKVNLQLIPLLARHAKPAILRAYQMVARSRPAARLYGSDPRSRSLIAIPKYGILVQLYVNYIKQLVIYIHILFY